MRQIPYSNSAASLRFEIPSNWDVTSITSLSISITDRDGNTLLAGTSATLYTATTLNAAASVGDSTITLANTASALSPGDRIHIAASASGPAEECEVQSYNGSTYVATLRHELRYAHANSTAVRGLWATYNLDTSTTTTWTKGKQLVIAWTPGGIDTGSFIERGEIAAFAFFFPDFAQRFEVLFPREWRITEYRTQEIYEEAKSQVIMDLSSRELNIERLIDTDIIRPAILYKARWLVVQSGGDKWESERTVALDEYNRQIEIVTNQPVWIDENQDGVKEDIEVTDHAQFLGLERGH